MHTIFICIGLQKLHTFLDSLVCFGRSGLDRDVSDATDTLIL